MWALSLWRIGWGYAHGWNRTRLRRFMGNGKNKGKGAMRGFFTSFRMTSKKPILSDKQKLIQS